MEGTHGGSSSPAPFLVKTYDMIQDPVTDSIVSWSPSGRSFVVWNPPDILSTTIFPALSDNSIHM